MPQEQRPDDRQSIGAPPGQSGFWEVDLRDMALTLSDTTCAISGLRPAGHRVDDFLQLVHPDERRHLRDTVHAALRDGAPLELGYRIVCPAGEERHVRARAELLRAGDGRARYLGTIQDVTDQVRRQREAELNARLLQMASPVAHIGGWTYDTAQGRVIWSDEVCRIHEVPAGPPLVEEALSYFVPESRARLRRLIEACLRDGTPYDEELQLVTARGRSVWVRTIGEASRGAGRAITGLQGAFQDITDKRRAEQQALRVAGQLAATLESITDAFYTLDREWRFTYLNREAERLFKRPRAQLLGKVLWDEFAPLRGQLGYCEFHRALRENRTVVFEEYYAPYQTLPVRPGRAGRRGDLGHLQAVTWPREREADRLRTRWGHRQSSSVRASPFVVGLARCPTAEYRLVQPGEAILQRERTLLLRRAELPAWPFARVVPCTARRLARTTARRRRPGPGFRQAALPARRRALRPPAAARPSGQGSGRLPARGARPVFLLALLPRGASIVLQRIAGVPVFFVERGLVPLSVGKPLAKIPAVLLRRVPGNLFKV